MLVLSRKVGESIVIGHEIEVTVNEIRGGRVKLGVTAPGEVKIVRSELPREGQPDESSDQKSSPADAGGTESGLAGSDQSENRGRLEASGLQP